MSTFLVKTLNNEALQTWYNRIIQRMIKTKDSSVVFVMGKDFRPEDLDWIETRLIPNLYPLFVTGAIHKTGTNSGCQCWASPCEHCSGRELVVSL